MTITDMEARADKIGDWNTDLDAQHGEIPRLEQASSTTSALEKERLNVELKAPPRVSVWQNADLQKRDTKKQILAAAAAPVGVILLVCMGVAWLDVRQRRVRSAGEVSTGLGIRVVGAVPGVPHLERRLVGPNGEPELEGHPVLESIDAIRTQLLHDDGAEAARVVLVTSAAAGEGKTTLAGHLASSLARAGRKTLLIDGDLRRPSVHQLFELPMQPGFSEVLLGEVEVADAVQNTHAGRPVGPAGRAVGPRGDAGAGPRRPGRHLREAARGVRLHRRRFAPGAAGHRLAADRPAGRRGDPVGAARREPDAARLRGQPEAGGLGIRVLGAVVNGADPEEVFAAGPAPAAATRALVEST